MDEFRVIITVLSMVLGLGVTRLLLGFVTVFRTRAAFPIDWVPLVWAGVIFTLMLQYWWAINFLSIEVDSFNFGTFVYLTFMTLFLFLAAALVLPNRPEDEAVGLRVFFERDGRYALLAITAFLLCSLAANLVYFRASLLTVWGALDLPMIVIPCLVFASASRLRRALLTAAYGPLCLIDIWVSLDAG